MAGSAIETVFSMKCTKLFMPYFFCRDRLIHVFNAGRNYSFLSTLGRFLSHGSCQVSQSWDFPGFSVMGLGRFFSHGRFLSHGFEQISQSWVLAGFYVMGLKESVS